MTNPARWGDAPWGEASFAFSATGASHRMRVRLGVSTNAYVQRLADQHRMVVTLPVRMQAFSIGYGPAPIHPMRVTLPIVTVADPARLKFGHRLRTTLAVVTTTDATGLRFGHSLRTTLAVDTQTLAYLSIEHRLRATLAAITDSYATKLRVGHLMIASLYVETITDAVFVVDVPLPVTVEELAPEAPDTWTSGVVNLIRNPVIAETMEGWEAYGGAEVTLDTDHGWYVNRAAALEVPTIGGQGMTIAAAQGLAIDTYGGSVLWGETRLATSTAGVTAAVWTRAAYTDGTTVDGEAVEASITVTGLLVEDWQLIFAPFVSLDDDKLLSTAWLVIEPTAADTLPVTLYVGAAQLQYDPVMTGPSDIVVIDVEPVEVAS